ncbi:MAG: 4Fe-4S dicluster domain-containing protein [Bacteroidales bacterium]|nr:4Fe-4S dicluster domain-containing protein [Bacteroidales bacterium]
MDKNTFIFDINKCVGCMACVVGCSIENGTLPKMNWREVNTFNQIKHPDLPVFHFSLACNHCEEAPCMHNCPALAYTRDEKTGAIIHHAEACIGCKLCTWACPYDAPKFNEATGVIEKCTFCIDRIDIGQKPACADACPIGALDFGLENIPDSDIIVPGFVNRSIRPSIRIVPLRENSTSPEIWNLDATDTTVEEAINMSPKPVSKVQLSKEWVLVVFTLATACLVGWLGANVIDGIPIKLQWFLPIGLITMLLSSVHLGKKLRAWRSILNIRRSWLSREIVSFVGFLGLGSLYLALDIAVLGYIALVSGILTLISMDMLYRLLERKEKRIHSALTILTGIMVFIYLTQYVVLFGFILSLKLALYISRKEIYIKQKQFRHLIISIVRISPLIIALIMWFSNHETTRWFILIILLFGELIDRSEFYHEAEVVTPKKGLSELMEKYTQ